MSTATGTPVFVTVGGDASEATATYTPSGATTSTTVTLGDLAASVASNTTAVAAATSNASAAVTTANSAQSAATTANTTAASALTVANAAIPNTAIGKQNGVVGMNSASVIQGIYGIVLGTNATGAWSNSLGNQSAASEGIYNFYYTNGTITPDATLEVSGGAAGQQNSAIFQVGASELIPLTSRYTALGNSNNYWSGIVSESAVQVISDSNDKTIIGTIGASDYTAETTKLRAAWAAISGVVYTLNTSTNKRNHIGVIAQTVQSAFTAQGLDPSDYGLWCSTPKTKQVESTVDGKTVYTTEPVYEADGKTQATQQTIRYEELLSLGIFCERLERADLAARVTALEAKSTPSTTA